MQKTLEEILDICEICTVNVEVHVSQGAGRYSSIHPFIHISLSKLDTVLHNFRLVHFPVNNLSE